MAPSVSNKYDELIEQRTRWWSTYPTYGFNVKAKPRDTLDWIVGDVFGAPRKLARSVSAASLTYFRESDVGLKGLKRSPTYSSLSPSHALPYDLRVATRYIDVMQPRKVTTSNWYLDTYVPYQFRRSMTNLCCTKPVENKPPIFSKQLSRPYENDYLKESCAYGGEYVRSRLRFVDRSLPYVRTSYERPSSMERYLRFWRGGSSLAFVGTPTSLPTYTQSRLPHRIYMLTSKLPF
ncbi:Tyrosine decarboxylase [Trichinella pseudospiralis]